MSSKHDWPRPEVQPTWGATSHGPVWRCSRCGCEVRDWFHPDESPEAEAIKKHAPDCDWYLLEKVMLT